MDDEETWANEWLDDNYADVKDKDESEIIQDMIDDYMDEWSEEHSDEMVEDEHDGGIESVWDENTLDDMDKMMDDLEKEFKDDLQLWRFEHEGEEMGA